MQLKGNRLAARVALTYVVVAACWILFSDELLKVFVSNPDERIFVSILKGWGFVVLTGILLHQMLRRWSAQWERDAEQRRQAEAERLEAGEKLRRSEERLRLVLEASADGVWDRNLTSGTTYLSPRYREIAGIPPGEVEPGFGFLKQLVLPEDWPGLQQSISDHVAGKSDRIFHEFRMTGQDGGMKWILGRGKIAGRAADGAPLRMVGTITDITQRKQAERSLIESERRYHELFQHMNEGLAYCRMIFENGRPADFVYLEVNPMFTSLTGLKDVEGRRVSEVIPGIRESDPELFEIYGRVALTGKPERFERFIKGLQLWFDVSVYGTEEGCFVTVFDGITERKKSEVQLRQLSRAVEQSPVAVVITDVTGKIEYVNQAFTTTTGYAPEEALGKTPRILKSGAMPCETYANLWATITSGRTWAGELQNRKKNGDLFWERATISPLLDHAGKVTHYIGVKEDISKGRQLQEQLRQAQKMEAVGTLAGGIAHDFNNILAATLMQLSLLQQQADLTPEMRSALQDLEQGATRAASLTRQLLLFSRRQVMEIKPLEFNELLSGLVKMLRRLLGENIDLLFHGEARNLWVDADKGMMEQIITNLCINARDAISGGGRITIGTGHIEFDAVSAKGRAEARPGKFVCLSVADTGCGMNEEILGQIFEPFFTTKEVGKGTGLGLATVFGIVKQHQGWLEVESEVGVGSVFRVFLPAREAPPAAAASHGPKTVLHGKESILMVEDNAPLRAVTARWLQRLGYEVLEAANGQEAMEQWKHNESSVALLLTDMVMPGGMSGLDLAERLRKKSPDLKVIISTGYSLEIARKNQLKERGIGYLAKPYEGPALAAMVRQCLDGE